MCAPEKRAVFTRGHFAGLITVVAGLVIFGCGGGGGGSTSSSSTASGSTASGSTANGSTANGSTANGSTANGSTANGSTANGSTANGSTANGSTANGTTSGTAGVLPQNVILYSYFPTGVAQPYNLQSIPPTGGAPSVVISNIPSNIPLVAVNPNQKVSGSLQYVFFYQASSTSTVGLYTNTSLSLTGATTLVSPTYSQVVSLSVSQDGKYAVYTAFDSSGNESLFEVPLTGGAAVTLDVSSQGSSVSTSNPDEVVYVKPPTSTALTNQVFAASIKAGAGQTPTQLTSDTTYSKYAPVISRDGTLIAYDAVNSTTSAENYIVDTIKTSATTILPNPSNYTLLVGSFNSDGSMLAVTGAAGTNYTIYTQTVSTTSTPNTLIAPSAGLSVTQGVYWTSTTGRGISGGGLLSALTARRRNNRTH